MSLGSRSKKAGDKKGEARANGLLVRAKQIIFTSRNQADVPIRVGILSDLGVSYHSGGMAQEADSHFLAALKEARASKFIGPDSPELIVILERYVRLLKEWHHDAEAAKQESEIQRIKAAQTKAKP